MTTKIGSSRYANARNAYTGRIKRLTVVIRAPVPSAGQPLGPDGAGVDEQRDEDQPHQDERERGGGRVVEELEELRLDDVPDHVLARRPEQLRVDEVARGGDEREERA